MKFETDNREWAQRVFGDCDLGDERRVRRLVELATLAAGEPEASTSAMCRRPRGRGSAYRFMRNRKFETADIDDAAYMATAETARDLPLVLAIQDTTAVSFTHATAQALAGREALRNVPPAPRLPRRWPRATCAFPLLRGP